VGEGAKVPGGQDRTQATTPVDVAVSVVRPSGQGVCRGVVCGPPGQVKPTPQTWQPASGVAAKYPGAQVVTAQSGGNPCAHLSQAPALAEVVVVVNVPSGQGVCTASGWGPPSQKKLRPQSRQGSVPLAAYFPGSHVGKQSVSFADAGARVVWLAGHLLRPPVGWGPPGHQYPTGHSSQATANEELA
jgi:hypothetical protein